MTGLLVERQINTIKCFLVLTLTSMSLSSYVRHISANIWTKTHLWLHWSHGTNKNLSTVWLWCQWKTNFWEKCFGWGLSKRGKGLLNGLKTRLKSMTINISIIYSTEKIVLCVTKGTVDVLFSTWLVAQINTYLLSIDGNSMIATISWDSFVN